MWYGTFANPMIPCWNVWKRSQWRHRTIFTRSLYTFGNIISPVPILALLFSFSFIPVNGLMWYGLKNTVYKVELKSTLSELLKAEAKQNYILLSLYSLLSSAVFLKKIVKPKSASPLHHSNISIGILSFPQLFPPFSIFISFLKKLNSTKLWTSAALLIWQQRNPERFLLTCFLTNILQSSDCFILCPFSDAINMIIHNLSQWKK